MCPETFTFGVILERILCKRHQQFRINALAGIIVMFY
jgi:hypothetical protein